MTIIDDLLVTLDRDAPVRGVRIGAFWTAVVLEDGRCGLASALQDNDHHHGQNPVRRGFLPPDKAQQGGEAVNHG